MSTVNYANPNTDLTVRVFDRFYEVGSKKGIQDFTEYIERNASEL
jgi:hypothetical protein